MSKQNWKAIRPLDLRDAMDWCIKYARAKHNRSVDTIADLMGVNKWTLYKWMAEADMPARLIKTFEHACGIDYVSRWLVESSGKLVVAVPSGKKCGPRDIQDLQKTVGGIDLSSLQSQLADLQARQPVDLSALQSQLDALQGQVSNIQPTDLSSLLSELGNLKTQIGGIQPTDLSGITSDLEALQSQVSGIKPVDLSGLQSQIDALKNLYQPTDLTDIINSLAALQSQIGSLSNLGQESGIGGLNDSGLLK